MPKRKLKPSKAQTILSIAILMALFGIGIDISIKQSKINPAVIAMQPAPLDSPSSEPVYKTLFSFSKGMTPLSSMEVFDQNTLSDKINGKADFYLSAGFIKLKSQRFTMGGDSNLWAEMFVYDMENAPNAYAVFSAQKRHDARSLNVTHFSYAAKNALFFIHGSYYIEMIASENTKISDKIMLDIAKNYISQNQEKDISILELSLFPMQNFVKGSIVLLSANVFGCENLNQVFSAIYNFSDMEVTGFISRRNSPQEAKQLTLKYHDFLMAFGGKNINYSGPVQDVSMIEMFGSFEVIFSRGQFIAGVHESENREFAENLTKSIDQKISEVIDEY